jgi:hypothetical protein
MVSGVLVCACASSDDGDSVQNDPSDYSNLDTGLFEGEDANEPGEEEQKGGFAPTEGEWTTLDEYLPLDACNMADWVSDGPGGTLILRTTEEAGLEISHGHGTEECSFDESGFECLTRESEDTTAQDDYGLDALILLELSAGGVFDGRDLLEMQTEIVATCTGDDCWMVELATAEFPCEMQVVLEAEAR